MKRAAAIALAIFFSSASPSSPSAGGFWTNGPLGGLWPDGAAEELLAGIIEGLERDGATDDGVERLQEFIEDYPRADVTDEALITLGRIYMERREFEEALGRYQRLLEKFPASAFKGEALYGFGYCQYRAGRLREARTALDSAVSYPGASLALRARARILLEMLASPTHLPEEDGSPESKSRDTAIGVLLPLKGNYSKFGEEALKGVLLAANLFGERGEGTGSVEVVLQDTGSESASPNRALGELSANSRVMGVVGPLLSRAAQKVARKAAEDKIPLIVLSQKAGIPGFGDYVFRNSLTPDRQAVAVAAYAIETLEAEKFAILSPRNSYGRELARLFKEEVLRRGGTVVGELSYATGQKDFGREFETLFGIEQKVRMEGRRRVTEYTSTVEVDALYIPDYPETIAQIAPYRAYYNVKDVQLLGSNGWNSRKLIEIAGRHVEGAVFADGFFADSNREGTAKFVKRFTEAYGHKPGILSAQAYDAAMVLISAVSGDTRYRDEVRNALAGTRWPGGATGEMSFDPDGETAKELFILTVRRGSIVELQRP
ncbi:MAG: penicillin-binding protein activator [Thermodesulfobacteriota bacterium]